MIIVHFFIFFGIFYWVAAELLKLWLLSRSMWLSWECSFPFMSGCCTSRCLPILFTQAHGDNHHWQESFWAGWNQLKRNTVGRWLKSQALSSSPSMGLFMWPQYSLLSCYNYSPLQYMHQWCITLTHKPDFLFSLKCGKSESTDFAIQELPDGDGCSFLSCVSTIGVVDKCVTWAEWYPVS